jgi:VanZ family protein
LQHKKKFLGWMLVLVWMGLIFALSADPQPYRSLPAAWQEAPKSPNIIQPSATDEPFIEVIGRYAHVFEYIILGGLVFYALYHTTDQKNLYIIAILAVLVSSAYALSDEIHQYFVDGRRFQWLDLVLDTIGSSFGALLLLIWYRKIAPTISLQKNIIENYIVDDGKANL